MSSAALQSGCTGGVHAARMSVGQEAHTTADLEVGATLLGTGTDRVRAKSERLPHRRWLVAAEFVGLFELVAQLGAAEVFADVREPLL